MDAVECASKCLLGLPIKSKAQIWFNWIIPIVLELLVYIVLIVADFAVTYQHFIDGNHLWAGLTLSFIWLPAILCFCSIIASPRNWPEYYSQSGEAGACQQCLHFFLILIVNVLLFPVGAFIRFGRRLFWSIDALFHHRDSYERYHSLTKATENSAFELYHFLQAFTQSGPQILLQLYILLRENVFRNYDTSMMQATSVIFSLLQMAIIAESYQRFESQHIVGRNYPWHPPELCQERKEMLQRRTTTELSPGKPQRAAAVMESPPSSVTSGRRELSENVRWSSADEKVDRCPADATEDIRKTMHVDQNNLDVQEKPFRRKSSLDSIMGQPNIYHIEIDGHTEPISDQAQSGKKTLRADVDKIKLLQQPSSSSPSSSAAEGERPKTINVHPADKDMTKEPQLSGDSKLDRHRHRRPSYLAPPQEARDKVQEEEEASGEDDNDYYCNYDTSPTSPPPPLPVLSPFNKILNYPLNRLSTITDMFLLDTELYVKEHVPRLPDKIARHEFKSHHTAAAAAAKMKADSQKPLNSILIAGPHEDDAVENSMTINVLSTEEHLATQQQNGFPHKRGYSPGEQESWGGARGHSDDGDDVVDGNVLMMPRRRRMIVGLEQEDFFAKTVGFLAWAFFILMRLLSISVFAVLHWREALYICLCHYFIMLGCLLYEVKLQAKMQRLAFYLFLSYVYVFVILEFKIKFIHLRMWYGLYVGFVFTQNFVLSVWWYVAVMDFELWWFDYLFRTILGSGVLSLCCLFVYYLRLKPKDKVLFELMEETDQDQQ